MPFIFLFVILLFAGPAAHALTTNEQRIIDILTRATTENASVVTDLLNAQQRQIGPLCAPLKSIKPQQLTVINDPTFDLAGNPKSGAWQVGYKVQACGAWFARSVLFKAAESDASKTINGHKEAMGKVAAEALEPGETLADPNLRKDVISQLRTAAARATPACTTFVVNDSRVLEPPKHAKAKWKELWQIAVCPNSPNSPNTPNAKQAPASFVQVVSFYPSPVGTMFRMSVPPAGISPTVLGQ